MEDIAPALYEKIKSAFENKIKSSKELAEAFKRIRQGKATHRDSYKIAELIGEALAGAFKTELTPADLPDERLYWNIGKRAVEPLMKSMHAQIGEAAAEVQEGLNKAAGLSLKGISPKPKQELIDGILNRLDSEDFSKVRWILDAPVVNYAMHTVDETIEENADFHARAGLRPRVTRIAIGGCCEWCNEVAGVYEYPGVPKDVWRRHDRCKCIVVYDPGDGKLQNVWTKQNATTQTANIIALQQQATSPPQTPDIPMLKNSMGTDEYNEFFGTVKQSPEMLELYEKYGTTPTSIVRKQGGGVYKSASGAIEWDYASGSETKDGVSKFATLAHEYGHSFDYNGAFSGLTYSEIDELNAACTIGSGSFSLFKRTPSQCDKFLNAVRMDKEFLRITLPGARADIVSTNASAGVQDAIDGFWGRSNAGVRWGHGEKYYNRKYSNVKSFGFEKELKRVYENIGIDASNQAKVKSLCRIYDTASEMWANISSAVACQDTQLEWVKNYLPNSYNAFMEIIQGAQ